MRCSCETLMLLYTAPNSTAGTVGYWVSEPWKPATAASFQTRGKRSCPEKVKDARWRAGDVGKTSWQNLHFSPGNSCIVEGFPAGAAVGGVALRNEWPRYCLLPTALSRAAKNINDGRKQSSPSGTQDVSSWGFKGWNKPWLKGQVLQAVIL